MRPLPNALAHQGLDRAAPASAVPVECGSSRLPTVRPARLTSIQAATRERPSSTSAKHDWTSSGTVFDYSQASNPIMSAVPVQTFPGELHQEGESRVIAFDLSSYMELSPGATSPNLQSSFVRVRAGDELSTSAVATSNAFYVIRGNGRTTSQHGELSWSQGDIFTLPATQAPIVHHADHSCTEHGGPALYWIHDGPLLSYLGVTPSAARFAPALYKHEDLRASVEEIRQNPDSAEKNRIGVLLSNKSTADSTKTLTHVLWALYDVLPAHSMQKPHRHAATALDMAISAPPGKAYTLMARELDSDGQLVDPIKVPWSSGGVFTTPPGWWHSHHNDSDEDAWVFPVQDAGLLTYQRVLNIRFVPDILNTIKDRHVMGAAFEGSNVLVPQETSTGAHVPGEQKAQQHNLLHRE